MTKPATEQTPNPAQPARDAWKMFRRNKAATIGLVVLSLIFLISIFGPSLYGGDAFVLGAAPFTPPGTDPSVILGTDFLGRDVAAGLIIGGRATLLVGASAAVITIIIGVLVGATAGFYGGIVDELLMRVTEFFQVLPALLFAMVLIALFAPSLVTITIAIGVVAWPQTARLTRAEFLRLRETEFVKAERSIGASNARLIWKVILPNAAPPLIVIAALSIGSAILFEAGLSFLGLSDPNATSWGRMIGDNRPYILDSSWGVTFPGLCIFLTVLAISLVGDGLNDAFNPKLRQR